MQLKALQSVLHYTEQYIITSLAFTGEQTAEGKLSMYSMKLRAPLVRPLIAQFTLLHFVKTGVILAPTVNNGSILAPLFTTLISTSTQSDND